MRRWKEWLLRTPERELLTAIKELSKANGGKWISEPILLAYIAQEQKKGRFQHLID